MQRWKKPLARLLVGISGVVGMGQAFAQPTLGGSCGENQGTCSIYFGLNLTPETEFGDPLVARDEFLARLAPNRPDRDGLNQAFSVRKVPFDLFVPKGDSTGLAKVELVKDAKGPASLTDSGDDPLSGEPLGRFNTSPDEGGPWWESTASFVVNFTSSISAFGFYATDVGDFLGSLSLTLVVEAGDDFVIDILKQSDDDKRSSRSQTNQELPPNGSLLFFGFADTQQKFKSVTFNLTQKTPGNVGSYDSMGFDDFVTGPLKRATEPPGVPEPASLALVAASLAALAATRRRLPNR